MNAVDAAVAVLTPIVLGAIEASRLNRAVKSVLRWAVPTLIRLAVEAAVGLLAPHPQLKDSLKHGALAVEPWCDEQAKERLTLIVGLLDTPTADLSPEVRTALRG